MTENLNTNANGLDILKSVLNNETGDMTANVSEILQATEIAEVLKNLAENRVPVNSSATAVLIEKMQLTSEEEAESEFHTLQQSEVALAKSLDDEQRIATAVVLRPDTVDLHGDLYAPVDVEKACYNFNINCRKSNLQHMFDCDSQVVESYIAPADFELAEGQMVLKGDWVMSQQHSPEVWAKWKDGTFTGYSVGCTATTEELK